MRMTTDEKYMRTALKQAEKAYNLGETPECYLFCTGSYAPSVKR